jgi:hypothetical protein
MHYGSELANITGDQEKPKRAIKRDQYKIIKRAGITEFSQV